MRFLNHSSESCDSTCAISIDLIISLSYRQTNFARKFGNLWRWFGFQTIWWTKRVCTKWCYCYFPPWTKKSCKATKITRISCSIMIRFWSRATRYSRIITLIWGKYSSATHWFSGYGNLCSLRCSPRCWLTICAKFAANQLAVRLSLNNSCIIWRNLNA